MSQYRPLSLITLGVVAVVIIAGTFVLLYVGRPVPEPVWVAWGVIVTALFGHGAFLAQAVSHSQQVGQILTAVTAGARAATNGTSGTVTSGSPSGGTPTAGHGSGPGPAASMTMGAS